MRLTLTALVVLGLFAVLTGCGGGGVTTGTLAAGTRVHPEQYLADTRQTALAIQEFAAVVNGLPRPLSSDALKQAAEAMVTPITSAQAAQDRLAAMRLEDQRLETQRGRVRTAAAAVIAAMGQIRNAAARGDMAATKRFSADLQTSIAALRAIGVPVAGG